MSNHRVIQELENQFIPYLNKLAGAISQEFPEVKTSVGSWLINSQKELLLGLECFLSKANPSQSDFVALTFQFNHLSTTPKIVSADVCWENGIVEVDFFQIPVEVDDHIVDKVERILPELQSALRVAIKRGQPLNDQAT